MLHIERAILLFSEVSDPRTEAEIALDRDVIAAVQDTAQADRVQVLRAWMQQYSVLAGFSSSLRDQLCELILDFADEEDRSAGFEHRGHLLRVFQELQQRLDGLLFRHTGEHRDLTALCSKALWCMYPQQMPIYNLNVRAALATLSRLMDLPEIGETTEFGCFLARWHQVYAHVAPLLKHACGVERYISRARYFDRFLWFLGNPLLPCSGGAQVSHLRETIN